MTADPDEQTIRLFEPEDHEPGEPTEAELEWERTHPRTPADGTV